MLKIVLKDQLVIGLIGEIASGKDTVAQFLADTYGSATVSFSRPLRDILDTLGQPQSRINLINLSEDLRSRFGQDVLAKAVAETSRAQLSKLICVPNIRLPADLTYLSQLPRFVLVAIDTDQEIRYQRLVGRSENVDDKTKTWEEFLEDAKLSTEVGIKNLMKEATITIKNNGSVSALCDEIITMLLVALGECGGSENPRNSIDIIMTEPRQGEKNAR